MKRSLIVAIGGLAVSLSAGAGIASADPVDVLINSTCTYNQAVAAINATDPAVAAQFNSNPMAQSVLRQFVAKSPAQRRADVDSVRGTPAWDMYAGPVLQAAATCSNF
jgi:hemophore-related protein